MIKGILRKIGAQIMVKYIEFVYATSKVHYIGHRDILTNEDGEKVTALFWHGDSYCLYPALKGTKIYIVTTKDKRGDYISDICSYFGYKTLRLPDNTESGNYIFKIAKIVNGEDLSNIAITMDGPLGPYHIPKDFPIAFTYLLKRKVMPVSIHVKRKIELTRRWDRYKIPLPFNTITVNFNQPIEVLQEDKKDKFEVLKGKILKAMDFIPLL